MSPIATIVAGISILTIQAHLCIAQPTEPVNPEIARLGALCSASKSLVYESKITVTIGRAGHSQMSSETFLVNATLQHPGLAYLRESTGGKTIAVYVSNPQQIAVYSAKKNSFAPGNPAPAEFAVADIFTGSQLPVSDQEAEGPYIDLWGYFSSYTPGSPWVNNQDSKLGYSVKPQLGHVDGHVVKHVVAIETSSDSTTTYNMFFDAGSGYPIRIAFDGTGPALDGPNGSRTRMRFQEDYLSFVPSQTAFPPSVFEYTPPVTAKTLPSINTGN